MRIVALYQMLFGLITLIGGILGFLDEESITLLLIGLISGILLVSAALRIQKGWRTGLYVALAVSLVLIATFGGEYSMRDGAFLLSGLIGIMGIVSILLIGLLLVQPRERRREF